MPPPTWNEVETELHSPGRAILFGAGLLFIVVGCGSFAMFARSARADFPVWLP